MNGFTPNRSTGGRNAKRAGATFQKVVVVSADTCGLIALTELPPSGGRQVARDKFIHQKIPCDFVGTVKGAGRAIFFDAKCLGDDYASFPINNQKILKDHQRDFLRDQDDAWAIAGVLVESKRLGRYLWLAGRHLHGPATVAWSDPLWVDLGSTTNLAGMTSVIDFGKLLAHYGLWKVGGAMAGVANG